MANLLKGEDLELSELSDKLDASSLTISTTTSDSYNQDKEEKCKAVFNGRIVLNPGISPASYYASLIHVIVVQFNHTVTTALQPLILLDPASYEVDKSNIGIILAELMLLQTLTKICLTPFYGFLMDNIGRKPMVILGAFVALFGYSLVPFQQSVFPGYAISKILVANGGNMMTLAPLNADYIHDSTKGKATGITMALGSAGQFFGTLFITLMLRLEVSYARMHVIAGISIITIVLLYSSRLKKGKYYLTKQEKQEKESESAGEANHTFEKFIIKIKQAFKALGQNGWLMISLAISILARADYYLVTIVFALFVKSFDEGSDNQTSSKLVNHYQNLFFFLSFSGNIFYGFILDRVNTIKIIFPTLFIAMIGYTLGIFADSKESVLLLVMIIFAGTAMPGLLNSANYLAIKNFPRELRGILSSLLSVIGVAGYLFLSTIGGYSFDNYGRSSPFFLFVIMLAGSMMAIIYIYNYRNLTPQHKKKSIEVEQTETSGILHKI